MDPYSTSNHLAVLQHRAKADGSTSIFKIPKRTASDIPQEWMNITVAQLAADVNIVAHFLATELKAKSIPSGSVVSLWFSGLEYPHLVYILALARASYIPQPFSHILTNPTMVFELMTKAGSKAIIYDPSFESLMTECPFPKIATVRIRDCPRTNDESALPNVEDLCSDEGVCFLFLTSGSTSGSPKLVPTRWKSMCILAKKHSDAFLQGRRYETQDVLLGRASICHIPAMIQYIGCLYAGSCFVQPLRMRFSTEELENMVNVCGLNHLTHYGTFLSYNIEIARKDPKMLKLLQDMRIVSYDGVSISVQDDDWCFENGIRLIDLFANTECGLIMASTLEKQSRFLRPWPGVACKFEPALETTQPGHSTPVELHEFVLLGSAPEAPQPHLLSADGNFHAGDLFEPQSDGTYISRGRNDDWIKTEDSDRCDTKSIEANVRETCKDLLKDCVVVGNQRPSPALFVEVSDHIVSESSLKEMILERIKEFNDRRFFHEKITEKELIRIVPSGALPRTLKGNYRRKAIEEKYSKELDAMYAAAYGPPENVTIFTLSPFNE